MGKLKRSSVIKKNQNKTKIKAKLTIEELLDYANQYMDQCDLETAYKYVKQALDMDPKHIEGLETMAAVQMEMGNTESAKNIYEKLIELNPNEGFSKYMCLAQLSTGIESVNLYKKGIDLMLIQYNKEQNDNPNKNNKPTTSKAAAAAASFLEEEDDDEDNQGVSKSDISTAYGSVAELYLTDLCMEENADNLCKSYLDKSLEYDSENPESLQLLASYWLSKEDIDQAKKAILDSLETWLPKYIEADENGLDPIQVINLTYDSRINTTRILTEVNEFDKAVTVLEQLIEEDDEVVVVWYMLGWVNYSKGEDYYSNAKFYLKKANELSAKMKYEQKYLDDELKTHINELLEKLTDIPTDNEDEDNEEEKENIGDDENEYETSSEDEEEEKKELETNNNTNNLKLKNGKHKITDNNNNNEDAMELT